MLLRISKGTVKIRPCLWFWLPVCIFARVEFIRTGWHVHHHVHGSMISARRSTLDQLRRLSVLISIIICIATQTWTQEEQSYFFIPRYTNYGGCWCVVEGVKTSSQSGLTLRWLPISKTVVVQCHKSKIPSLDAITWDSKQSLEPIVNGHILKDPVGYSYANNISLATA